MGVISSRMSTPKSFDIFSKVCKSGCIELLHHLLTVQLDLPNCSANHFPVFVVLRVQLLICLDLPYQLKHFRFRANIYKYCDMEKLNAENFSIRIEKKIIIHHRNLYKIN